MQRAQFGPWEIEYDREATQAAYAAGGDCNDYYCGCQGCMNYLANARAFPKEVRQFFDSLGIDPTKPSHLSCAIATGENRYFYDGYYHAIGRYISGQDLNHVVPMTPEEIEQVPFRSENSSAQYFRPVQIPHTLADDFSFGFTQQLIFVPKEIPEAQAVQIEFSCSLPWLLTEPKDECYIYKA